MFTKGKDKIMKILLISSGYYPESCGGVETITQVLAEGLIKKNQYITVLYSKEEFTHDETYKYNGVKVIKMSPVICRSFINNKYIKKINRYLQMYNFFNKSKIRKIIKAEKPDLIHIHMPRIISYSVYRVASEEHIPTIATLHEYYSLWNYNPFLPMEYMTKSKPTIICSIFRFFQKRATIGVDYVLSPYYEVIENYRKFGYFASQKSMEIQNAINLQTYNYSLEIDLKKQMLSNKRIRSFLLIGRLIQFKGIEETLEAFYTWNSANVELLIAGEGPLQYLVENYTKKDSRIKYFGFVKDESKQNLFRRADVLLFLVSNIETFGLVCLEGYSYGMPAIVSNTGATKRIVEDGKTGMILDNVDKDKIQNAMEWYLYYDNWKKQIDECMKKLKEYNCDCFIEKHLNLYKEIIKEI